MKMLTPNAFIFFPPFLMEQLIQEINLSKHLILKMKLIFSHQNSTVTFAIPPSKIRDFFPLRPISPVYVASTLVALLSSTHVTPLLSLHTA